MQLRPYQINTINELYNYIRTKPGKNPCLVLPTGAGKSIIIAKIAEDFYNKSSGNLLMLTHVKELIQQNYDKVVRFIPPDDVGIFNAGLGKKQLDRQITFGSIQSIINAQTPEYKVIMIDEAHRINTKFAGHYRIFLEKHPNSVIIGLTATPFRTQGGYLNLSEESLFHDLIYPKGTGLDELISCGYLSPLRSKGSDIKFDFKGVDKNYATGDYNEKQVIEIMNKGDKLSRAVSDMLARTINYKHVLVFCAGVDNTEKISGLIGEDANYVHGGINKLDRDRIINDFKNGVFKYLCNANILTTGFDFPNIDCVVMLRPTQSTSLYVQIAGRGMRLKDHTDHCILLDYVGNVERHGSLLSLNINQKDGKKKEDLEMKRCPSCMEIIPVSKKKCPACGFMFEELQDSSAKPFANTEYGKVSNADIMGGAKNVGYTLSKWQWKDYKKKKDGKQGIMCILSCGKFANRKFTIFFTSDSFNAYLMSSHKLRTFCNNTKIYEEACVLLKTKHFKALSEMMNRCRKPRSVVIADTKAQFPEVTQCMWG